VQAERRLCRLERLKLIPPAKAGVQAERRLCRLERLKLIPPAKAGVQAERRKKKQAGEPVKF